MKKKIGILAYGSLIDNPGTEIEPLIIDKIECLTPFKVEYARISNSRNGAPTLIPYEIGKNVKAVILVLNDSIELSFAKTILWRRERHKYDGKEYLEIEKPSINQVVIKSICEFEGIENVIYTSIGKNIEGEINSEKLSSFAINSILNEAGENKLDGLRYLLNANNNGIITTFSKEYTQEILNKTNTKSLEESIKILDLKRKNIKSKL